MSNLIKLGSRTITSASSPYIIAEIGVNHEGSIEKAKELIELAKAGGADAAKFQSYKANKLASKFSPSYWDTTKEKTKSQYELFKKYDNFSENDYQILAKYCKKLEIEFLSTPFDEEAIEFLDELMPFYKIASADITNIPFLRSIATKEKPIILSTGASTLSEIDKAISTIQDISDVISIALLHCILNYPTPNKNANLEMISSLKTNYPNHIIGYSDHTIPDLNMTPLMVAYLKGAVIIEKHFTDNKNLPGNDHYHAMDVNDLKLFKQKLNYLEELIGFETTKKPIKEENISRDNARRSIVAKFNLNKGEELTKDNIIYKRPGTGISPIYWDEVLGKKTNKDIKEDMLLKWTDFD